MRTYENLNLIKMMYITFDESKGTLIPETLVVDYFKAGKIKSRFAVMGNMTNSLLEFNTLQSALRFVALLANGMPFITREFYDNFRIVEITGPDNHLQIVSIIVNLVDFFDVLCGIQDGKLDKNYFVDEDFNLYYEEYKNII